MQEIDRVAIAPLKLRYGHRKFYSEYLPVLGIQTQKEGKNAYITQHEAQLLEKYHEVRGRGEDAIAEFLEQVRHVPEHVPEVHSQTVSVRTGMRTTSTNFLRENIENQDISRVELLRLAGTLQEMSAIARWMATAWILESVAMQQIVIIRPVLLVLLERDKLPRQRQFQARGFEFQRVSNKNNEEWLAVQANDFKKP
jgi:hypothetical protein